MARSLIAPADSTDNHIESNGGPQCGMPATPTLIYSIILLLGKAKLLALSLTDAPVLRVFICGGTVICWFCGASMQAVTTGAYRVVEFINKI